MTPKALFSLLVLALIPAAATAQNPSKARRDPNDRHHSPAPAPLASVTSVTPPTPAPPPTGPVVALPVLSMKMLSSATGWASTGSQLFLTTDNGADWKDISPPTPSGDLYAAVFFLDPQTGWLLTAHSDDFEDWRFSVWRTSNGGATWSSTALPPWRHNKKHAEPGLANHGTIAFADLHRGWVSLDLQGNTLFGASTLLTTCDGGRNWDWAPDGPDAHIGGMVATTDGQLWTVGQFHGASVLDNSRDGFFDFDAVSLPAPPQIAPNTIPTYDLPIFADARNGHEVVRYRSPNGATSAAVLYSTFNGGRTWQADGVLKNLIGSEAATSTLAGSAWILPFNPQGASAALVELPTGITSSLPSHHSGDFGRCTISFFSQAQGWSDCAGHLTATANGGTTWTEISPRASNGVLTSYPVTPPIAVPPLQLAAAPAPAPPASLTRAVSQHLGFDSSILPDPATMNTWWQSSPYYDIGIYAPGSPSGPTDPALTTAWVTAVSQQGWGILPIWPGLQSPCACNNPPSGFHAHDTYPECRGFAAAQSFSFKPTVAEQQGEAQAKAAFSSVKSLGLDGSIIYLDIENYDASARDDRNPSLTCGAATQAYVTGWVKGMHQDGGAGSAGVYGMLWDAVPHSPESQPQAVDFQGADSVFLSRADNRVTVWGLNHDSESQLDDTLWPARQRIHQFRTGAQESWGGASLYIDSNVEDAPVAGGNGIKPIVPTTVANVSYGSALSYLTGVADGTNYGAFIPGQAVGVAYTNGAWSDGVAFTWTAGKTSSTGNGTPLAYGTISTVPFAINNLGQVVGYYRNLSTDIGHGFLYTPGAGYTNFDIPGAIWTELYSINDAGWILGGYANKDYVAHCVLYKPPYTTPILFDDPGGSCFSTAVNGLGQIVGSYPTDPSETAFVPFVNDAQSSVPGNPANYLALSTPSPYTFPQGINNNGVVTGEDANLMAGFFLDPRNTNSYATLTVPGTNESTLLGLNDTVQAAGWVYSNQIQGILLDTTH